MSADTQFLLHVLLSFGIPFALGIRELIVTGPRRPGWDRGPDAPAPRPAPLPDGEPATRRLPACLIPVLPPRAAVATTRERVFEDA